MKTIFTTLPIYDDLAKQCYEISKHSGNGIVSIFCPRYRLPSFQYDAQNDETGPISRIYLVSEEGVEMDITSYFINVYLISLLDTVVLSTGTYYRYLGGSLFNILPCGTYYLKILHSNTLIGTWDRGNIYYSEWFSVMNVYPNLLTDSAVNNSYDIFTKSASSLGIDQAQNTTGTTKYALSNLFPITKGKKQTIYLYANLILSSGQGPSILIQDDQGIISNSGTLINGPNVIALTIIPYGTTAKYIISNTLNCAWQLLDMSLLLPYSHDYLKINFFNTCNLGDINYQANFTQSLWIKTEPIEPSYPEEEEGQKNGDNRFVRTFARQIKQYLARTNKMPGYMVDVFNRMKLHDNIELIDLVGDVHDVHNLSVDHEWLFDDKYTAKFDLTFDYNEVVIIAACCENTTQGSVTIDNGGITIDNDG